MQGSGAGTTKPSAQLKACPACRRDLTP